MAKTTKKKRPESVVEVRVETAEGMLREAALAYAAVADLDPSDRRWLRCWRALQVAAYRVAESL